MTTELDPMEDRTLYEITGDIGATKELFDLVELAWGLIANAGGGEWETQSVDWQGAAARWRERYHKLLSETGEME